MSSGNLNTDICLPFPCTEGYYTPIRDCYQLHEEDDTRHISGSFYFTIPMDRFRPSPCSFLDNASTRAGEASRLMLLVIFHILDRMFYGEHPDLINIPDGGGRRFRVFMEYLLNDETDPEDFTLIDCVGVRFHIHVYDQELDFLNAILKMIEKNSGTEGSLVDTEAQVAGDDEEGNGRRKRKRGNKKGNNTQKKKLSVDETYKTIQSTVAWLKLAGIIADECDFDLFTCNTDDKHIPSENNPFHPKNLFSWEKSLVPDMRTDQKTLYAAEFPLPHAVYYVTGYMTSPHAILGVTLPRTPMWFKQSSGGMVMETLRTLNKKEYMETFFILQQQRNKRNDLSEIKQVQKQRMDKLVSLTEDPTELLQKLKLFRRRSVKYLANAWNPTAFVSDPIKLMAKEAGNMETWYNGPTPIIDSTMSSFGNFIVDTMFGFENILRISTTHTVLLRVLVNSLDAYRYEFNLHNNVLLVGEGSTGKSHILEMLEDVLFVPDSVSKVTHMTKNSMTGDRDENDAIRAFHEMPEILMGAGDAKGGAETGSGNIKDMMTSCRVKTESMNQEDSDRIQIKTSSERVGVLLMASNERSDRIPEALATRMIMIQVNSNAREKFTINDMTSSVDGVKGGNYFESDNDSKVYVKKWRVRQMLVNMVEKMIYIGALVDVNIRVFETIQLKMTNYMKHHGIMQKIGNDREIKFLKRFARTLTLIHAIDKFVSDPQSPGFNPDSTIKFGSSESFNLLLDIQPYLFCTEEIALFTMTLNIDQLIEIHHFQVLEVILECVKPDLIKQQDGENEIRNGFWFTKASFPDERYIYSRLSSTQKSDIFPTKMSSENIKVAFRQLRRRVYYDNAIIEFSTNTRSISINYEFINEHFTWNDELGRYVCNFDVNTIMTDVFYKSYANTFTKPLSKVIIGATYDRELPFLFDTMEKKPNPEHVLTRHIAQSNSRRGVEGFEETADYVRNNDTVKFKVDFEDFCFEKYLSQCGYDPNEYNVTDLLYDHHIIPENPTSNYPEEQVEWFTRFTGIIPKKYRQRHR
jgi:hypothetical protein